MGIGLLGLLAALTGCGTTVTVKATAQQPSVTLTGQRIYVAVNDQGASPYLNQHVRRQLKRALTARGVRETEKPEEAAYRLEFSYGVDGGEPEPSTAPPARLMNQITRQYEVVYSPPGEVQYAKRLKLRLVPIADPSRPAWIGEATNVGESNDLRDVVDFLIAAGIEQLGRETGSPIARRFWPLSDPIGSMKRE
ncbi:MAG: hypothetical protein AB1411_16805 [Nitrospirota bacterium]